MKTPLAKLETLYLKGGNAKLTGEWVPSYLALRAAEDFYRQLWDTIPIPDRELLERFYVSPTHYGGVLFHWNDFGFELEVDFEPGGTLGFLLAENVGLPNERLYQREEAGIQEVIQSYLKAMRRVGALGHE
jgi:hypothetical protein